MGTCLSTVLPRRVLGTPREGNPSGKAPLSGYPNNKELPGEVNGNELPESVNSRDEEHNQSVPDDTHSSKHLSEDVHHKTNDGETKRRALLIGITYTNPWNTWSQLDGPHGDVDQYQDLLLNTYGYRPEDIVVLKDLPEFPEQFKPTQVNMLRELKALVSDAKAGDKFTFFYSGHSDQEEAKRDLEEEDGMDEMLITSDEKHIIDDELKVILVNDLPVGCTLLAILDTCHSGTLLDLPHYHCNGIYVPWQSKGERRTMTMQNING
jgi:hypothetical protein